MYASIACFASQVPVGQRSPPVFRDMMPDTHRALPPEQFGVAGAFPGTKQASMSSSGMHNKRDSGYRGQVSDYRRTTGDFGSWPCPLEDCDPCLCSYATSCLVRETALGVQT